MLQSGLLTLFAILLVFAVPPKVCAIKCWRCSSDVSTAAFCNDPFDESKHSDRQRSWASVECSYPPGQLNPYSQSSNQRAVCRKVKQLVYDKIIVSRSCFCEEANAPKNECMKMNTPSPHKSKPYFVKLVQLTDATEFRQPMMKIMSSQQPLEIMRTI